MKQVLGILKRLFGVAPPSDDNVQPEARYVVTFDEESVVCTHPNGTVETVLWDELGAVLLETNDSGPWGIDVLWLLVEKGARSGCVVPQGATGEEQLLHRLQELPGFDNKAVIAAMSSVENQRFLCWEAEQS